MSETTSISGLTQVSDDVKMSSKKFFLNGGRCVYDIILTPWMTEKALAGSKSGEFCFLVDIKSNKKEIAFSLESIYDKSKVISVNVISMRAKKRRFKGKIGALKRFKKAIVKFEDPSLVDIVSL